LLVWERFTGKDLEDFGVAIGSVSAEQANIEDFPWPLKEWSLERIIEIHQYVARQLSDSDGKVLDSWDETTAILARIILEERSQADFEDHVERMREITGGVTSK
jgi:hypothetical protein